jgi:hypothetical protein
MHNSPSFYTPPRVASLRGAAIFIERLNMNPIKYDEKTASEVIEVEAARGTIKSICNNPPTWEFWADDPNGEKPYIHELEVALSELINAIRIVNNAHK